MTLPTESTGDFIEIYGAREHNLQHVNLHIPRNQLVVITGVSGSGKSSLAFDTLYAEGQRRYMETFSAYVRQFIGGIRRPDVEQIFGLSPVIAIDQKTTSKNPRSTVGTVTEIYDFLRLLFARISEAFSYHTGRKMEKLTDEEILQKIMQQFHGRQVALLAPVVRGRKGHYREELEKIARMGYTKVRIDGQMMDVFDRPILERHKVHDIEIVIDRLTIQDQSLARLTHSLTNTLNQGKGLMLLLDQERETTHWFCRTLMDPETGLSYPEPEPNTFSFNSPYGACATCNGMGYVLSVDVDAIVVQPESSIRKGAIELLKSPYAEALNTCFKSLARKHKFDLGKSWSELPEEVQQLLIFGEEHINVREIDEFDADIPYFHSRFLGIGNFIKLMYLHTTSEQAKSWAEQFLRQEVCPDCQGARLKKESLYFRIDGHNIYELSSMDLRKLLDWFEDLESRLTDRQNQIAYELLKEIRKRIGFMIDVGLEYLTLNRTARSLSGGESQRIRLATQIGSQLVGVLYILDEPSIGLHQRDNHKLIQSLKNLRDLGNSVIVVEHDQDIMLESDYLIDIGPGAGVHGGRIIAEGTPTEFLAAGGATADYLSNRRQIPIPEERREPHEKFLVMKNARGNNLKNVDFEIPLGLFVCVTGVSGSGKSSLINQTLYPILHQHAFRFPRTPLPYDEIHGLEYIDKVIEIDQKPIGRTPRSNPATYTGLFTHIRDLFAKLPESQIRGYKPGRFSFNVKGGRCEQCGGAGVKVIEMNFLPDVHVECPSCRGRRYNRETLEIRYKGKSISDVLNMTVSNALEFFASIPNIKNKLQTLEDVGLGYIRIGQPATTLSGGEAQRMKIATELSKRDTGKTFYILDEPTTGLHFQDIEMLLNVLNRLVGKGNTIMVIEHNLDVIKVADWVIDLGPEGGDRGGDIIATGPPEAIADVPNSYTGQFLKPLLAPDLLREPLS